MSSHVNIQVSLFREGAVTILVRTLEKSLARVHVSQVQLQPILSGEFLQATRIRALYESVDGMLSLVIFEMLLQFELFTTNGAFKIP